MFGSQSEKNGFFAPLTRTIKILILLANTWLPTRPNSEPWMQNPLITETYFSNKRLSQLIIHWKRSNKQNCKLCCYSHQLSSILLYLNLILVLCCRIHAFPFTKWMKCAIMYFIFVSRKEAIKPNHFLCYAFVRSGNTKAFFWIRSITLDLAQFPLIVLGADVLSNQGQATCLTSGWSFRKTTRVLQLIERLVSYGTLNQ